MRLYLSGKMSGLEDFGFSVFNPEARRLRNLGYEVVNPAEIAAEHLEQGSNNQWLDWIIEDLKYLKYCDAIAMLPRWKESTGATIEHTCAKRTGMPIYVARKLKKVVGEPKVAVPPSILEAIINNKGEDVSGPPSRIRIVDNPKDVIATNKMPMHLVSPIVRQYDAIAQYLGNVKYGAWNWRVAGARASVYTAAFQRHVDAWFEGQKYDPTDGTPHLANAKACLNILIEADELGVLIDDRPPSGIEAYMRIRKEFEELMPRIREQYSDKDPRHFTIADTQEMLDAARR